MSPQKRESSGSNPLQKAGEGGNTKMEYRKPEIPSTCTGRQTIGSPGNQSMLNLPGKGEVAYRLSDMSCRICAAVTTLTPFIQL